MGRLRSADSLLRGAGTSCLLVGATSCGKPDLPPDFGGEPFWATVEVNRGEDLGDPAAEVPQDEAVEAGTITLTNVAVTAGLDDTVGGGNTHGVGAAFVDLDGDDWADIVVINGISNASGEIYASVHLRNQGDGTFAPSESGLADALAGVDGYSIATADIDADGDIDIYVGAQPRDILLRNRGDGTFEDATEETGAGGPISNADLVGDGKSKIVSIADFDGDGFLDLTSASSTLPSPGAYLLRGRGDGTFEDITEASGILTHPVGNPCAVLWSDYDTDGDRDLWIWNDRGGKILLRNDGGESLTDVTAAAGLDAVDIGNPMGIDGADIDHDGDLDYYVSNIGNNPLLRNNGDGTFLNISAAAGVGGEYGWGLAFEDFDADGWHDIFVAQEDNRPNLVFRNRGEVPARFDMLAIPHPEIRDASAAHNVAVAFADYDHDGRTDVLTAGTDGSGVVLYRNETELGTHGWLDIIVNAPLTDEPNGGVGARVGVGVGDDVLFLDVTAGSSRASQNELTSRFGLGQFSGARWAAVLWPSGRQRVVRGVPANQRLVIE